MITKKNILWTFLVFVAIAMLTGIAAVLLPTGWIRDEILVTIFIIGAYSLGGIVIVATVPKHGKHKWTLRTCVATLSFSMVVFISTIWIESTLKSYWNDYFSNYWEDYFWKSAFITLIIGVAATHWLMILPLNLPLFWFRIIKRTALIAAAAVVLIITIGIINDGFWYLDELFVRILSIAAIIAAGSTIATGAIAIFAPKPGEDEQPSYDTTLPIQLTCPRCSTSIKAQSNKDSRCPSCKLKVRVEIKEPRCTCGYLLYQLNSQTCPECGKPIPTSEQWGIQHTE